MKSQLLSANNVNSIFEPNRLCNMPFLMSVVQFFFHSVVSAYVCVMLWCHSKWVFVLVNSWWPSCNVQCIFGFYKDHLLAKYPISSCMHLMSRFSGNYFSVIDGMAPKVNRSKSPINLEGRTVRAKLISQWQLKNLVVLHGIHRYTTTAEAGAHSALVDSPTTITCTPKQLWTFCIVVMMWFPFGLFFQGHLLRSVMMTMR